MSYIVVFNVNSSDVEIMTNGHGFKEEFATFEDANNEAMEWLDDNQYRDFKVFAECSRDRNHVV